MFDQHAALTIEAAQQPDAYVIHIEGELDLSGCPELDLALAAAEQTQARSRGADVHRHEWAGEPDEGQSPLGEQREPPADNSWHGAAGGIVPYDRIRQGGAADSSRNVSRNPRHGPHGGFMGACVVISASRSS